MAEYGRIEDVSGGIDGTGGGVFGADASDIPPRPSDAPEATVTAWPPASWGPKLYEIDTSGNRVAAARPGE
jgi:hypothetical protein